MATTTLSTLLGLADVKTIGGVRSLATVDLTQFDGKTQLELLALILIELRVHSFQLAELPNELNLAPGRYAGQNPAHIRAAIADMKY